MLCEYSSWSQIAELWTLPYSRLTSTLDAAAVLAGVMVDGGGKEGLVALRERKSAGGDEQ
jgi:hypothetical protein